MKLIPGVLGIFGGVAVASVLQPPFDLHQAPSLKRQLPGLPQECLDRCDTNGNLDIYDDCFGGRIDKCLGICQSDIRPAFQDCLACFVQEAQQDVKDQIQPLIDKIDSACDALGISGSATATSQSETSGTGIAPSSTSATNPPTASGDAAITSGAATVAANQPNFIGAAAAVVGVAVGAALAV